MNPLPRISIITPSYNQAQFIEQTIQSVLSQDYPDLEYIVVDGGSTDGTLEILKKYDGQLTWTSEPDHGQSHAINKGLQRACGEVLAFLNSDDLYEPCALLVVGKFFRDHDEALWLTGYCLNIDEHDRIIRRGIQYYKKFWLSLKNSRFLHLLNFVSQPATFWRRSLMEDTGYLDENLQYTMDYDCWLRFGQRAKMHVIPQSLARFRIHAGSKSGTTAHRQFDEELLVAKHYGIGPQYRLHHLHCRLAAWVYKLSIQEKSAPTIIENR